MEQWVRPVAMAIEAAGVLVIVVGALWATGRYLWTVGTGPRAGSYRAYRSDLGRSILLGLEFLVAGDIISTILVESSLEAVGVLAVIVLIRTFLSFSLEMEIEGRLPWRRAGADQG